jgi:hypothetical protein
MSATQEQLDIYCIRVLQPLAESLMQHSKEMGESPSAFYQACMHRAIYALNHIQKDDPHKELDFVIGTLMHVAKQMAEAELEKQP